jgi:hypothetical protein
MSKMTEFARGRPCEIRLDGCLPGTETVVFAHLPSAGIGMKNRVGGFDWGCPACFNCHNILDGRILTNYDKEWLDKLHKDGTIRFQQKLAKEEKIFIITRKNES